MGRPAESEGTCAKTSLQWINEAITERRQINIQNLSGVTDEATTHVSNLATVRASQSILPVHHVYTIHTDPSTAIPQTVAQCCVQSHDHNNTH